MEKIDIDDYCTDFVRELTSEASNNAETFIGRVREIDKVANAPLLLSAAIGLGGEGGEFLEVVMKVFFHGKDLDDKTKNHLKKELGDIIWYWANACRALSLLPSDVVGANVEKLEDRYPGGEFDKYFSENRKDGDV